MFTNLKDVDGIVQYIGWYQCHEPDGNGQCIEYYNIVLERAEFDLYTAIRVLSPPISYLEIRDFWDTMYDISRTLMSIHEVEIGGENFHV